MDLCGQASVVQLGRNGSPASGQRPQAIAPGQLRKRHGVGLLGAVQIPYAQVATVAGHDPREGLPWQVLHDLGEEGLTTVQTQRMQAKPRRTVAYPESIDRELAVVGPA